MGHMVEDRHPAPALADALAAAGVDLRPGAAGGCAEPTGMAASSVVLDDGEALAARLLVGADGKASTTARRAGYPAHGLVLRPDGAGLRDRA